MFRIANDKKGWSAGSSVTKIIPVTETIKRRKMTILGHVIRAGNRDPTDPMYQVTFEDPSLKPKTSAYRRVGRPRRKWHQETMNQAWQSMQQNEPTNHDFAGTYAGTEGQRLKIKSRAIGILRLIKLRANGKGQTDWRDSKVQL